MSDKIKDIKQKWAGIRKSSRFHDLVLFLLFVVIATVFWFVMVMNDNVEDTITLKLNIYNKPDSLTYIDLPPAKLSVSVRDKGTLLLRNGMGRSGSFEINFREYAENGVFRMSNSELYLALREKFGSSAQILSVSVDSLRLAYTSLPGKRIPIDISADVSASLGNVISGKVIPSKKYVTVYSANRHLLDTVTRAFTEKIVMTGISETTSVTAKIHRINGARISPEEITIKIPVEALVNKMFSVPITAVGVPEGSNMLIFPASVEVEGYLPMSKFNQNLGMIRVEANYRDIALSKGSKIPVKLASVPSYFTNVELKTDSVEYTIVKNN